MDHIAFELSMPKLGYISEFICEESTPNWGLETQTWNKMISQDENK